MGPGPEAGRSPGTFRDLILLGVCSALLFTLWLGARDLWNPNEPLYGQAVAEMAARGDWLIPTVNGSLFPEKPILYYWAALAGAAVLGGVGEWSLRLPSAASGIAGVLLLYLLVRPYAGRRRALMAATLFGTTFVVFWSARQVQMDLLLAACTLATLLPLLLVVDHRRSPALGWALAGAAAGLGFLSKGPVGLICPGLVFLLYLAGTRRLRELFRPAVWLGAAGFLLVAAPWYLLLAWRGEGGFLVELLYRQNVERFLHPWDHQAPWGYYLKYLWIDMLPWSPFLPLAWALPAAGDGERRLNRLAWIWLVGLVVFFSLSASKRSPYILPAAPALAVLVSGLAERWWVSGLDRRRLGIARLLVAALGLVLLGAAVYLAGAVGDYHPGDAVLQSAARTTVALLGAGGLVVFAGLALPWRRRFGGALALVGVLLAVYLFASARVLPAVNSYKSHRAMCEAIRGHVAPDEPLRGFHVWKWRASYSYYTGRPVPPLRSTEELEAYWSRPERVFVVVEESLVEQARGVIGPIEPLEHRRIGDNAAYLFANRSASAAPDQE